MPSPPEDRLRERAHELLDAMWTEPCVPEGEHEHDNFCDAIYNALKAERADAAREARAEGLKLAAERMRIRAGNWASVPNDWGAARNAEALEAAVDLDILAAREAAPVTPGKGTP